jgi:predicted DNA-binding transcriptional regulator AlpA
LESRTPAVAGRDSKRSTLSIFRGTLSIQKDNPRALGDILHDPALLDALDPAGVPALLGEPEEFRAKLLRQLLSPAAHRGTETDGGDRLLGVEEAAVRLGMSKTWLYHKAKALPFVVRQGRALRFSSRGIERYLRLRIGESR